MDAGNVRHDPPSRETTIVGFGASRLEEFAWAAGLVDGEGHFFISTGTNHFGGRPYLGAGLTISQAAQDDGRLGVSPPEVLVRFRDAVLGIGRLCGPYRNRRNRPLWQYRVQRFEHVQAVTALLWKHLSAPKRAQAAHAFRTVRAERAAGVRGERFPAYQSAPAHDPEDAA